jgi:hypothetical protein
MKEGANGLEVGVRIVQLIENKGLLPIQARIFRLVARTVLFATSWRGGGDGSARPRRRA